MAYPVLTDDKSLGELVAQATKDLSTLVRKEVELAKTELSAEVGKAGKGAGMFGAAGAVGLYAIGFALLAATYGLGEVMPLGWAALIVAGFCLLVAGILALTGKRTMSSVSPKPERTIRTLKEDAKWARHPTS